MVRRLSKRPIESYDHRDKQRLNNSPVGLVTPATDRDGRSLHPRQNLVDGDGLGKGGESRQSDRTLYEILDDFAERIPQEIKDQFPDDFIANMDHYLYGAGNRWPPSS